MTETPARWNDLLVFGDAAMMVEKANAEGDLLFRGVLATTHRDKSGEAFTHAALISVAKAINELPIDLIDNSHKAPGIRDAIGTVSKAECRTRSDGVGELYIEGYLFGDDPFAPRVYRQMAEGRVHLSIQGRLTSAAAAYRGRGEDGLPTRFLDSVNPVHALACRKGEAINPETWTQPISKALEDGDALEVEKAAQVSETAWDGQRGDLPKSSYLVMGETWTECRLPVYEPDDGSPQDADGHYARRGALNSNAVRAALAAVAGDSTAQPVNIPGETREKLNALAEQAGIEVSKAMGETTMQEPMPVEIVGIAPDAADMPPSANFVDNAPQTSAEARYWEAAETFDPLCEQLRQTIRGVCALPTPEERMVAFVAALDAFSATAIAAVSEDIAKAGARHSAADIEGLHTIISRAMDVCGCGACPGTVSKATEETQEITTMSEEVEQVTTETETAPVGEGALVAKANETTAQLAAAEARIAALELLVNKATEQLEVLKAAPAEGGPEGKPSGLVEKADGGEAPDDILKAAVAAKDSNGFFQIQALRMQGLG